MTLKPISPLNLIKLSSESGYMTFIDNLYHNSFPPEERRPWQAFVDLMDRPHSCFSVYLAVNDNQRPLGFITLWELENIVYAEHFAVDPECRGGGLGARVIGMVLDKIAPAPLVLEVEPTGDPEFEPMASRRVAFYERNGLTAFPQYDYRQPPYSPGQSGMRLMLMSSSTDVDLDKATRLIHQRVYGCI